MATKKRTKHARRLDRRVKKLTAPPAKISKLQPPQSAEPAIETFQLIDTDENGVTTVRNIPIPAEHPSMILPDAMEITDDGDRMSHLFSEWRRIYGNDLVPAMDQTMFLIVYDRKTIFFTFVRFLTNGGTDAFDIALDDGVARVTNSAYEAAYRLWDDDRILALQMSQAQADRTVHIATLQWKIERLRREKDGSVGL